MADNAPITLIDGEVYAGYAADEAVRQAASSGGVVSAILLELLAGVPDRDTSRSGSPALVSSIGPGGPRTRLARTREEVLAAGGSSYVDTLVLRAVEELPDDVGRVAVVALPCQVRALRRRMQAQPALAGRIGPLIGLFCRGNVQPAFYDDWFARFGIDPAAVRSVKVRRGHVKGVVRVELEGGGVRELPFMALNAYRVCGVHAKPMCAWCDEHLAAEADISVGDIFTPPWSRRPIKHSALIARGEWAGLVERMAREGKLVVEPVGREAYAGAFGRIERFGADLASRKLPARLMGFKAPPGRLPGRWSPLRSLAWLPYFANARLSRSRLGRKLLFALPRPLLTLEAVAIRALSRF